MILFWWNALKQSYICARSIDMVTQAHPQNTTDNLAFKFREEGYSVIIMTNWPIWLRVWYLWCEENLVISSLVTWFWSKIRGRGFKSVTQNSHFMSDTWDFLDYVKSGPLNILGFCFKPNRTFLELSCPWLIYLSTPRPLDSKECVAISTFKLITRKLTAQSPFRDIIWTKVLFLNILNS